MGIILTLVSDMLFMQKVCTIKQSFGVLSVIVGICLIGK